MINFVLAVVVFGGIVFVHEFGHFIAAKSVGVTVHEFSIGFGPRITSVKYKGTDYSLRLLPFFSYVRWAGIEPGEEPSEGNYLQKSVLQRAFVLAAGSASYFLLAAFLFSLLFGVVGVGQPTTVIQEVVPGYAAEKAGIRSGDKVIAVDGKPTNDWDTVVATIHASSGKRIVFTIERGGRTTSMDVIPTANPDDPSKGFIGIRPAMIAQRLSPGRAILSGVSQTYAVTVMWFKGLVMMVTGRVRADVIGPVGIVQMIGEASRFGLASVAGLAAAMAVNLGALNLLPIPALDGSKLIFVLVEAIRGRPVDPEKENMVHLIGFAILLLVAVFITYKDILKIAT